MKMDMTLFYAKESCFSVAFLVFICDFDRNWVERSLEINKSYNIYDLFIRL